MLYFQSKVAKKQLNWLTIIRFKAKASLTQRSMSNIEFEVTVETLQKSCRKIDTQQNLLATNYKQ